MSVKSESILDLIRQWAADHDLKVPSDTSLTFADANFDSLHSTELAFFLEEKLDIQIGETAVWENASFNDFASHLAKLCGADETLAASAAEADDEPTAGAANW